VAWTVAEGAPLAWLPANWAAWTAPFARHGRPTAVGSPARWPCSSAARGAPGGLRRSGDSGARVGAKLRDGLVCIALLAIAAGRGGDAGVGGADGVAGAEAGVVAGAAAGGAAADGLPAAIHARWERCERANAVGPETAWWTLWHCGREGGEEGGGVDGVLHGGELITVVFGSIRCVLWLIDKERTTRDKTAEMYTVNELTDEWMKNLTSEVARGR
jgi:hypothetical protein